MPIRLNDKEVSALAKKMADKQSKIDCEKKSQLAKQKLPEAKKIVFVLEGLPDSVLSWLYEKRYSRDSVNATLISNLLAGKLHDGCKCETKDLKSFEAEVVLAAHDCTTMAALCKKLEI